LQNAAPAAPVPNNVSTFSECSRGYVGGAEPVGPGRVPQMLTVNQSLELILRQSAQTKQRQRRHCRGHIRVEREPAAKHKAERASIRPKLLASALVWVQPHIRSVPGVMLAALL